MPVPSAEKKQALVAAAKAQVESLEERGVRIVGTATSPIVLVKGELNEAERVGGELLAGPDGTALRACLSKLGFAPEDFCGLACSTTDGAPLGLDLFREALETLDPEAVVVLDNTARDLVRECYADALVVIDDFDTAMLKPGLVAPVLGRRVLALDGFEAALSDKAEKQRMWAYLKQIKPAAAPY